MRKPSNSLNSKSRLVPRTVFVGRYAQLRIPRAMMRHTEDQLDQVRRALNRWNFPPVVVGDKREVLAGFGLAQLLNRLILGQYIWTIKYSDMTREAVREYVKRVKEIGRLSKWDKRMLAVELQYLKNR